MLTQHQQTQYNRMIALRDEIAHTYHAFQNSKPRDMGEHQKKLAQLRIEFATLLSVIFNERNEK